MEIAIEDKLVILSWAEVEANRKAAQIVKGLDLGALSRAETEDARTLFQAGQGLQALL